MKRLGQTHLSYMLTLSLRHSPFIPLSSHAQGPKKKSGDAGKQHPNPFHSPPLDPFSQHTPPRAPSYWPSADPIAWHLCFLFNRHSFEVSCLLWSSLFCLFFFCRRAKLTRKNILCVKWLVGRETTPACGGGCETKGKKPRISNGSLIVGWMLKLY